MLGVIMDKSLNFIDFLPLFFLLLFTYFYNEFVDIHISDESVYEHEKPQIDEESKEAKKIFYMDLVYSRITENKKTLFEKDTACYIDENNNTDFMLAIDNNNLELAKYLFERNKYNINQKNKNGENALLLCCYWYYDRCYLNYDIIEFLINKKIDVNAKDTNGNTALIKACTHNEPKVIELLLKAGAKVNEKNNNGDTALSTATSSNGFSLISYMLIKAGADTNIKDKYGNNILTSALHGERHFWAEYTDIKTYYHDNFFTNFYFKIEQLLIGDSCCPYHHYSRCFPFNSFN